MPKKTLSTKDLKTEINLLYKIIEIIGISHDISSLLQDIARSLAENIKSDSCLVYLADPQSKVLMLQGAWPPHPSQVGKFQLARGEGVTGWAAEHKKSVILSKNAYKDIRFKKTSNIPEDRYEAFLSIPIVLDKEVIGVINLFNKKQRVFSKNVIRVITSISQQIAGAIDKMRIVQESEKRSRQLETITKLSSSIVSSDYLNEIMQLIVTMTAQMMNSKVCSLMLFDQKNQELRIVATQSLSEEYRKKPPVKAGQSVSGKALQEKKAIAILDVTTDKQYGYPAIAAREGLRSMLSVPMMVKDKPIGVINCYTTTMHAFSSEEIDVMQTVANQAAIAIENTNLLKESQDAKEALETRKIIERAKGMLMKQRDLKEEEAFQYIQRQAMNMRRSMRDIAEAIILSEGLSSGNRPTK